MATITLREARQAAGLSQDQLAAKSGLTQGAISQLELGLISNPGIDTVTRLAGALGIDAWTLKFPQPKPDTDSMERTVTS